MHASCKADPVLSEYMVYTFAGSGIAGFCDGTLHGCTLAKPLAAAYDQLREAFFILDHQLTKGVRLITRDLGVHTLSWQADCVLRAPRNLAVLNNILLISDTGNRAIRYLLLTQHFQLNKKRSIAQFCSSTFGTLQTLQLDVTQPAAILPFSPTSFFVLDTAQRSVRFVTLELFINQATGKPLVSLQAVETLYVGMLHGPTHMTYLFNRRYILVADRDALVLISVETKKAAKVRLTYQFLFPPPPIETRSLPSQRRRRDSVGKNPGQQAFLTELKSIAGLVSYPLSDSREIVFITDDSTNMFYYALFDVKTLLTSQVVGDAPESATRDHNVTVYQTNTPMRTTGLRNGPLKSAEFRNPQGVCTFTLNEQVCTLVCDPGNSVIRLVGPDFLKQEKEEPVFLQIHAQSNELIMGRIQNNKDKHFYALHRALQYAVWQNTRKEVPASSTASPAISRRATSAPAIMSPSVSRYEKRKKLLLQYLNRSNRAEVIGDAIKEDQWPDDRDVSVTPRLEDDDPVFREIKTIERSMADIVQKPADSSRHQHQHHQKRPNSSSGHSARHRFSDASVQHSPIDSANVVDTSTQVSPPSCSPMLRLSAKPLQSCTEDTHTVDHYTYPCSDTTIERHPSGSEGTLTYTNLHLSSHSTASSEPKWEFIMIEQVWEIINAADADGSLVRMLDTLMGENHLFDVQQTAVEVADALLAQGNADLTRDLVRLALINRGSFDLIDEYVHVYQSLPFPKRFKPSIKCLLMLKRALAMELVQLSDIVVSELSSPLNSQTLAPVASSTEFLELLGQSSGYRLMAVVSLSTNEGKVPLHRQPGCDLGLSMHSSTHKYAFTLQPCFDIIETRISITVLLFSEVFKGKRVLLRLMSGANIVAVENYPVDPLPRRSTSQSGHQHIFHVCTALSLTSVASLTSVTNLSLRIACADVSVSTTIPVEMLTPGEHSSTRVANASASKAHTMPTWLIDLAQNALIISR